MNPVKGNNKRPVFLNLFKIRLPVGGVVSVFHRASGVLLALALPVMAYGLQQSLAGEQDFIRVQQWLMTWPGRVLWGGLIALYAQHFFSGLRHLLLDLDVGIGARASAGSAWLVFLATAGVIAGVMVWGW